MNTFTCNGIYKAEFDQFIEQVLTKYGKSAEATDRETIYLASTGNRVAKKEYADLIFYHKITVPNCYDKAFNLYLEAADIKLESGDCVCGGAGNPQAFAMLGYCLYNYKRDGHLKNCETIKMIEQYKGGDLTERIRTALYLAASCLEYTQMPAAINLIGRILDEASRSEELGKALSEDIAKLTTGSSDSYFETAAKSGYVYACNSLAQHEADIIVSMCIDKLNAGVGEFEVVNTITKELGEHIDKYVSYLKMSAEKYESYASNKLGLFYGSGEINSSKYNRKFNFRTFCDSALAKEYFINATMYPNKNSAWAYYNLIKRYPKDYNSNIDLLNEHMECIKRLDPKVYDLAMED